jgi:TorA maturation chaperone TorD
MPTRSDTRLLQPASDVALCRAVLYSALALGFRPPTDEVVARVTRPDSVAALVDAARVLETSDTRSLASRTAALARPDAKIDGLATEHQRLFGHTAKGEVAPYETEYGDEALFQQPQELSDIAGFMRAFGLTLQPAAHERIDHVSCECEFLSFLAYKEAYALAAGDDEMRAATERATLLFLRDHVARFVPAFARGVRRADEHGFYAALAQLLLALVELDCQRLHVATGSEQLGFRPDPTACAAPMGCDAERANACGAGIGPA